MNNSTANSTAFEDPWHDIGWAIALGFVSFLVCGSNMLILMAFTTKSLRRRSYYQVINLSVADLAVGIVVIPLRIRYTMKISTATGESVMYFADLFFGMGSFLILVFISCERCVAVCWPLKHRLLKRWHYVTSLALPWMIAALLATVDETELAHWLPFPLYLPVLALGLLVIFISYTALWVKKNQQLEGRCGRVQWKNRKLATTLLITTLASLATWLPFYICVIYMFVCGTGCVSPHIANPLKLLQFTNSFVNGVIYSLRMQKFRDTIKRIFCRKTTGLSLSGDTTLHRSTQRTQLHELQGKLTENTV